MIHSDLCRCVCACLWVCVGRFYVHKIKLCVCAFMAAFCQVPGMSFVSDFISCIPVNEMSVCEWKRREAQADKARGETHTERSKPGAPNAVSQIPKAGWRSGVCRLLFCAFVEVFECVFKCVWKGDNCGRSTMLPLRKRYISPRLTASKSWKHSGNISVRLWTNSWPQNYLFHRLRLDWGHWNKEKKGRHTLKSQRIRLKHGLYLSVSFYVICGRLIFETMCFLSYVNINKILSVLHV